MTGEADQKGRRFPAILVLVAGLLAILVAVIVVVRVADHPKPMQAQSPEPYAPVTGFGGYHLFGEVSQIGAQWTVPTDLDPLRPSHAATWIGVQSGNGDKAFIQIGTIEDGEFEGPPGSKMTPRGIYEAFWSDPAHGFLPVRIATVAPGDTVGVHMTLTPHGWVLVFDDKAQNLAWSQSIPYSNAAPFSQGEWIQEDPPIAVAADRDSSYATLTTVAFRDLLFNGSVPVLSLVDGQALSTETGTDLVPTPVDNGEFSLVRATGPALQYLVDATHYDAQADAFGLAERDWADLSSGSRSRDVSNFVAGLLAFNSTVARQTWPEGTAPYVAELLKANSGAASALATWLSSGGSSTGRLPVIPLGDGSTLIANSMRASLGLPPV